jgi:hypothetical protein
MRAFLEWGQESKQIIFNFPKELVENQLLEVHFAKPFFRLEEPVVIEANLLGGRGAMLKRGIYQIDSSAGFLRLAIACRPLTSTGKPYHRTNLQPSHY